MAWFKKSSSKELRNAEALLQDADARLAAIDTAVRDQLLPLVQQRLEAERALADAEVAGEQAAIAAAEQHLDQVLQTLKGTGDRVERQRQSLMRQVDGFISAYDALYASAPDHEAAVVEAFSREWCEAVAVFNKALSRRRALEQLFQRTLELPAPQPAEVELEPEISAPRHAMDSLRGWVARIANWSKSAASPGFTVPGAEVFNPDGVYLLKSSDSNIAAGTAVVASCLPAGRLRRLVAIGDAHSYIDPVLAEAQRRSRKALGRIADQEAEDAARRAREENDRRYRDWLENTGEGRQEKRRQEMVDAERKQRDDEARALGIDVDSHGIPDKQTRDRLAKAGAVRAETIPTGRGMPTEEEFTAMLRERTAPNRD